MLSHALLTLMLASPPAPIPVETVRTFDLGKMTFEEAKRLDGKTVRVSFKMIWMWAGLGGPTVVQASSDLGFRTVSYPAELAGVPGNVRERCFAEGVICTRFVPAHVTSGVAYPEVRDVGVRDARPVRP